jgi:hypothetical protein
MTTGRVFAASPRSANHTSPGWGLIEQVEDLLFGASRPGEIKNIMVGEINYFRDAFSRIGGRLRLPLAQPSIQLLCQGVHDHPFLVSSLLAGAPQGVVGAAGLRLAPDSIAIRP